MKNWEATNQTKANWTLGSRLRAISTPKNDQFLLCILQIYISRIHGLLWEWLYNPQHSFIHSFIQFHFISFHSIPFIHSFIHSSHTLLGFELSVAQLRRLAPISKERKIDPKALWRSSQRLKSRLRHRHIGCLISTKDLKVDCQCQRPDRVSITDMKSKGFATLFSGIFCEGFRQLRHLCVLACVERG